MRPKVFAPRSRAWVGVRALGLCAAAATTLGVGSCGASSGGSGSTITVSGTVLRIYASVPPGSVAADVWDAEKLAFGSASSTRIGKYTVELTKLAGATVSDNARTAIEDLKTIAYLGEVVPGDSADSLGITNAQDVLQVTPSDTALELTDKTGADPSAPRNYYEAYGTYGQTFARVVPNSGAEAKAQVQEMKTLGVQDLYVADDGSPYGAAIALAVRNQAAAAGLHATAGAATVAGFAGSHADAMFYGGTQSDASAAGALLGDVAKQSPSVKLFTPSALDTSAFAASFGPASVHLYASEPGFRPHDLPPAGQQFVSAFTSAYGHAPAPQAIFGYEAMKAVLAVLQEAGASANDRTTIVKDFLHLKNRASALGTYSITPSTGDTTLASFVFSRLRGGAFVPFASVSAQG
jgi:hypothetical protein